MKPRNRIAVWGLLILLLSPATISLAVQGARSAALPIRRIVLYRHGVGYFERRGRVTGNADVELNFNAGQMSDVLKSLVVLDLNQGTVSAVAFDSSEPLERRLGRFSVAPGVNDMLTSLASQLRGVRVEVATSAGATTGVITGFETRQEVRQSGANPLVLQRKNLVLLMDSGELRTFDFEELRSFRVLDNQMADEVKRYFEALQSSHQRDERTLKIAARGSGARDVVAAYTVEVPVWRTTYRVVMDRGRKPLLQGWAIVDNVSDEDWSDVSLALVSGLPVSFAYDLYQPRYVRRPEIQISEDTNVRPQTYEAPVAVKAGSRISPGVNGTISGTVTDPTGAVISGAIVTATDVSTGEQQVTKTDQSGIFAISRLKPGTYKLIIQYPGFRQLLREDIKVTSSLGARVEAVLEVGAVTESVTVEARPAASMAVSSSSLSSSTVAGSVQPSTVTRQIGELFEYKIDHPVTVARGQSAMVPIVQAQIEATPVSIYNEANRADHPMSGLRLTNSTELTLEGGTVTVIEDGSYAGETLVETIRPREQRYISYAVDLGLGVTTNHDSQRERAYRLAVSRGTMNLYFYETETKTYTLTNRSDRGRTMIIEHPFRPGWELSKDVEKPVEETPNFYRFQVDVPARGTKKFAVKERTTTTEFYRVGDITPEQLSTFVTAGYIDAETRKKLEEIARVKAQVADVAARIQARSRQIEEIFRDHQRVRQNLGALSVSEQERQLRSRYIEQLSRDEERLAQLRQENERDEQERARLQTQLSEMIEKLAVERAL
jgi:hypothetical protein